jgi:hypothetical protein
MLPMRTSDAAVLGRARPHDVSTRGVLAGGGVELRQPKALTEDGRVETVSRTARGLLGLWNSSVALRPADVRVFVFVLTRWLDQISWDAGSDGNALVPAKFTLTELLTWGRNGEAEFGGADYFDAAESLGRLFDAEISGHYSHGVEPKKRRYRMERDRLISRLHIESHNLGATTDPEERARILGAARTDTVQVVMSPWTVEQVRAGELVSIDIEVLHQLGGLAERLWLLQVALLGVTEDDALELPIGDRLAATLGINYARRADEMKALRRSAKRIVELDERFTSCETVKRDGEWFLRTTLDRDAVERRERELREEQEDRKMWGQMAPVDRAAAERSRVLASASDPEDRSRKAQLALALPEGGTSPD